ncbi:hypothetical protein H0X06_02365 [Candidatus Dependentiae bacterium]|nr:hypothetical protein [Candidatus Dependentiae bacterium]
MYDAYRPQKAVDHFVSWSKELEDQLEKAQYYRRVDKARVFELDYVAERSGRSRGSTIDLTIIKGGKRPHKIKEENRLLLDGYRIMFLNDRTVDMGSSFDLFDDASHHENNLIAEKYKKLRVYLKNTMKKCGFKTINEEWWHYTLKNEPYPADQESSYFNVTGE